MKKEFFITIIVIMLLLLLPCIYIKNANASQADVKVCFTPGERCDKEIVDDINKEDKRVEVQAYYLTSRDIIKAIISAKERGADVKVILDKSQDRGKHISVIQYLNRHAIPVWIDNNVSIAHNKVIILGNNEVITGSYNFTKSAQTRNAENMIIIKGSQVAQAYQRNFEDRLKQSVMLH